jgi:hypothetical protein
MRRYLFIAMLLVTSGCDQKHLGQSASSLHVVDLTVALKSNEQTLANILLKIEGDFATATVAGETERFNLKDMSWLDGTTGKWISLDQCKAWAAQSKEKSLASANAAPVQMRPFLLWSLDPTFKVINSDGTLRLTSGQVDYLIEGEASKADVGGYFRYAVLNAYKKAMTERKLPPFSELRAIDEMKALGHIPRRISVKIPGVQGAPELEIEITDKTRKGQPDGAANGSQPMRSGTNQTSSTAGSRR